MGKPAARLGDMHLCPKVDPGPKPHVGGPVVAGSGDVLINGVPAARVGDKLACCGPPDTIAEGSPTVLINGKPAAILGSATAHGGKITLGSLNVLIGTEATASGASAAGGGTGAAATGANAYQNPRTYVDPDTTGKNHDSWRRPKTDGNTVRPHPGTRPPDGKPIPIRNHAQRNKTETLTGGSGVEYTVTRDKNGFPVFTIFETYISDDHIGTRKGHKHFQAANNRLKTLLAQNPALADILGLNDEQIEFLMSDPVPSESPPDLTWHHHQDVGKMQLVNEEKHNLFQHTGGMAIWGGGSKRAK